MSELPDTPTNPAAPSTKEQQGETVQSTPPQTHTTSADPRHKATQFDGNPNPQGVEDSPSTLKPRDDTPAFLEKKSSDTREPGSRDTATKGTGEKKHESPPDVGRTMGNHPADPNALTSGLNFPPGIEPEEAADPGRETPNAPPVDDRSGTQE